MTRRLRKTGRKSSSPVVGFTPLGGSGLSTRAASGKASAGPMAARPKAQRQSSAAAISPEIRKDRLDPMPKLEV